MSRFRSAVSGCFLTLARLSTAFWVGGALLFVITSVAEQRFSHFDSLIRDHLATIRFPLYYDFGFSALGTGILASLVSLLLKTSAVGRIRLLVTLSLLSAATAITVVDYRTVYLPLQALISPPGQVRTQEFTALHNRSRTINELHLSLALAASVLLCFPGAGEHRDQAK